MKKNEVAKLLKKRKDTIEKLIIYVFSIIFIVSSICLLVDYRKQIRNRLILEAQMNQLKMSILEGCINTDFFKQTIDNAIKDNERKQLKPQILSAYSSLHKENEDMVGWLKIDDTEIDYPVMQTIEDEEYYLHKDFYRNDSEAGCLLLDTDSHVGVGTKECEYTYYIDDEFRTETPATNLIIHGHTMRNGTMFGNLSAFKDEEYGKNHSTIRFDSIYERREYELIAAFYSQVYYENDDVFKYYKFFNANTPEEFDMWYKGITELKLYDTGVTAEYEDEFITLSCCSYHTEDGRFVVVGKRVR